MGRVSVLGGNEFGLGYIEVFVKYVSRVGRKKWS